MKRYFVRNVSKTLASLASREEQLKGQRPWWAFHFDQNKIVMYDYIQLTENKVPVYYGLAFDCWVYSDNNDAAISVARGYVEVILAIVSYVAQVGCTPSRMLLVYNASEEELAQREFDRRFYQIDPAIGNLRPIDKSLFRIVFERVKNQDERIHRAMMWLRKSLMEEKHVDRFIACWVGLDALSKLLVEKLLGERSKRHPQCPICKKTIEKCPHCGGDTATVLPTYTEGIAELFAKRLNVEHKIFKLEWWTNRNKVLHGGGKISPELMSVLAEQLTTLRKALIIGIGLLVELPEEIISQIADLEPRIGIVPYVTQITGWLNDLTPPNLANPELQPWVECTEGPTSVEATEEGKITLGKQSSYRFMNANFSVHSHGIILDEQTGLKPQDYTLRSVEKNQPRGREGVTRFSSLLS